MKPLVLTYSHNVIEHLGLKLYQNRPTRVVAELVSNSWDADAPSVWIDMNMSEDTDRWAAVHDNGKGMSRDELAERFLVIGAPKRQQPDERSAAKRRLMGRKGIGKLAPFGIASEVDILTCSKDQDATSIIWLRLNLQNIKAGALGNEVAKYTPEVMFEGDSFEALLACPDSTGQVSVFVNRLREGGGSTGTLVLLRSLFIHRSIDERRLVESLGRRFTATTSKGFEVFVCGTKIEANTALPEFEFRIPEDGATTEKIGEREVTYWVGFVKSASWPQDEAGVGVYAHGKICQDRPFTFGAKGKEIFTRYMYAVVEADWLDEQPEDLISTDRTSINWDSDVAKELNAWGRRKVGQWVGKFESMRAEQEKARNKRRVQQGIDEKKIPAITPDEQEQVVDLLSNITPSLGKDEEAKDRLADAVASAWVQEPMRDLVKQVWSELAQEGATVPGVFAGLVEKLVSYSVPESLNLAVVFAQRAFALSKLHDFVHTGKEVDLQRLLEEFPWIIEPDSVYLTANQPLKSVVEKAEQEGLIPQGRRKNVAGVPQENKPDFVFLSSPDETRIVVVELKNPQEDLTIDNREQLAGYLTFLEAHYPKGELRGYLVGRATATFKIPREDMEVVPWTDVLKRSRSRYVTFLAAMLAQVPTGNDARVHQVRDFAGVEVWDLLSKIATKNQKLASLMQEYESIDGREKGPGAT